MSEISESSFTLSENSLVPKSVGPENTLVNIATSKGEGRTSGLLAPTVLLTGHAGEVYCVEFSENGRNVASCSFDKSILIYNVYGDCENTVNLKGHKNAVLQIQWSSNDSSELYSCSADMTVCIWDIEYGKRIKKMSGHTGVVNSCNKSYNGNAYIISGADDGTTKVWDVRTRRCQKTFEHTYQILSVAMDRSSNRIFSASLDSTIRVYDLRRGEECEVLSGHEDSITSVAINNNGDTLLSFAMDNTLRLWDVQPFTTSDTSNKCTHILRGSTHNFEKNLIRGNWSIDDTKIICGSADRFVYIWDVQTQRLLYRLPGHTGSTNHVCFHPKEPIIASASSDKTVYLGELS